MASEILKLSLLQTAVTVTAVSAQLFELQNGAFGGAMDALTGVPVAFSDTGNTRTLEILYTNNAHSALYTCPGDKDGNFCRTGTQILADEDLPDGYDYIYGVHVLDYNSDGLEDILIIAATGENPDSDRVWNIYEGKSGEAFESVGLSIPVASDFVASIDYEGGQGLLYYGTGMNATNTVQNGGPERMLAIYNSDTKEFSVSPFPGSDELGNMISILYADVDGDCLSDIVISNSLGQIEVWLRQLSGATAGGYTLDKKLEYTADNMKFFGPLTAIDMNRDGNLDIVGLACTADASDEDGCTSFDRMVWYLNAQIELCSTITSRGCRNPESFCNRDPDYELVGPYALTLQPSLGLLDAQRIRLTDIDLDGYGDLLVIDTENNKVSYFANSGCDGVTTDTCTMVDVSAQTDYSVDVRTFVLQANEKVIDSKSVTGTLTLVAPIDLDTDGQIDLLVGAEDANGSGQMMLLKNAVRGDAYFLDVNVLQAYQEDSQLVVVRTALNPSYGATVRFTIADYKGKKRGHALAIGASFDATPMAAANHLAGLGFNPNYVEEFYVGIGMLTSPTDAGGDYKSNTVLLRSIIPNSHVVVDPRPASNSDAWRIELFITPADFLPFIILALLVICLLVGIVIVILHVREKQEDERERKERAHLLHFDAM
eukprot:Clim_evm25s196 gene=Clim_evmTU25s196